MVRINLIHPKYLADQHLIAEYNEILMLTGFLSKHKVDENRIPVSYRLGKGHILFFANKLKYVRDRHEEIKKEMKKRGFVARKKVILKGFSRKMFNNYKPSGKDKSIIKKRLKEKILLKPNYYRYYGERKKVGFFLELIENSG